MSQLAKVFLFLSSLTFYSVWDVVYLPLLLLSIGYNYIIGNYLQEIKTSHVKYRKTILIFSITTNLSLLIYFKYANFFITNFNYLLNTQVNLLELTLPLAISFFTFQQIAYLIDSYEKKIKKNNFLDYAVFVSFFPQLIAGPIVHHKEMMPQFESLRSKIINYKNISLGLFIFSIGLFKKTVLADTFAYWADEGFSTPSLLTTAQAWATSLSYTFQIYFDFSGYTDMAIGAALLFNIKLPINFNSPYKATNIQDFWRRWHITLSRFLRDYLYIPLGGNQQGAIRTYFNILITFILGGLWHGASWTFIIWGVLHGFALLVYKTWEKYGFKLNEVIAWIITFIFINFSWVFFRANSLDDAFVLLHIMSNLQNIQGIHPIWILFIIIGLSINLFFKSSTYYYQRETINLYHAILTAFILSFSFTIMDIRETSEFLYFQF